MSGGRRISGLQVPPPLPLAADYLSVLCAVSLSSLGLSVLVHPVACWPLMHAQALSLIHVFTVHHHKLEMPGITAMRHDAHEVPQQSAVNGCLVFMQEHYEKALAQSTAREDALVRTLQRKAEKVRLSASISSLCLLSNQLDSVAAAVARMRLGGRAHAHPWKRRPDSHLCCRTESWWTSSKMRCGCAMDCSVRHHYIQTCHNTVSYYEGCETVIHSA